MFKKYKLNWLFFSQIACGAFGLPLACGFPHIIYVVNHNSLDENYRA
jgi:hypothetical protein